MGPSRNTRTHARRKAFTVSSVTREEESRLTEGTNELPLYRPGDRLDEGGGREASKQHVVQEDDVEVPQPVVAAEVTQEIKAGDAWKHRTAPATRQIQPWLTMPPSGRTKK